MHMKDDPLNRAWVEFVHSDPDLQSSFRKVLLAFHSTDANIKFGTAGTGFIVADTLEWLFFVTAKHVLEGIVTIQKPYTRFDSGPFNTSNEIKNVSLGGRLKVSVFGDDEAFLADVVHLSFNAVTDIAVGMAEIPLEFRTKRFWRNIPLAVVLPNVGDPIHTCSLINKLPVELEGNQSGRHFQLERGVTLRKGIVTNVFPSGYNQYKWPCFTTSIPALPGMSGGFAYSPMHNETIAACGVVCAELSHSDPTSFLEPGQSLIACSYLALANILPNNTPPQDDTDFLTLYEMVQQGRFPKPLGDFDRVKFVKKSIDDIFIGIK